MEIDVNKILKERAIELAKEHKIEDVGKTIQVVEFMLGDEGFAIETEFVKEVYPLNDFTKIPCTPDFILGVINLQGVIVSIVDIKKILHIPQIGITNLNRILILEYKEMKFGVLADDIRGVKDIPIKDIQKEFATLSEVQKDFFKGVTSDEIVILDGKSILSSSKLIVK